MFNGRLILFITVAALVFSGASVVQAYEVSWWTINGGGGDMSGGTYTLSGTVGQFDAGGPHGSLLYDVTGGYWTAPSGCFVDMEDWANFAAEWLIVGGNPAADLNGDNQVDMDDLIILTGVWLDICPLSNWPL